MPKFSPTEHWEQHTAPTTFLVFLIVTYYLTSGFIFSMNTLASRWKHIIIPSLDVALIITVAIIKSPRWERQYFCSYHFAQSTASASSAARKSSAAAAQGKTDPVHTKCLLTSFFQQAVLLNRSKCSCHVQVRTSCPGYLQQEHRCCCSSSSKPMLWLNLASCARLWNPWILFTLGQQRLFFTCGSTKPSANWCWPSHAAMSR